MSHNVSLSGVRITDLDLLSAAINNLGIAGGVTFNREAKTFRTYSGQPNKCDASITLPGKHDIGLIKQADGSYTMLFDPYEMSEVFVHPQYKGEGIDYRSANAERKVSALTQEYGLVQAEYQAATMGYTSQRIPGEKGVVNLEVYA